MEEVVGSIPTRSTIFNGLQPSLTPVWAAVGRKLENSDLIDYMKPSEFAAVVL
jgi:hypothetical protein